MFEVDVKNVTVKGRRGEGEEDQLGFGVLIALGHTMHCIGTHSALHRDTQYCAQDWDLRLYTVVLANKWKVWDTKVKMWVSSWIKLQGSIHPLPSFKKLRMHEARQEDTAMASASLHLRRRMTLARLTLLNWFLLTHMFKLAVLLSKHSEHNY